MKRITLLLITLTALWGCESEAEKAQAVRLAQLEAHYERLAPTVEALAQGLSHLNALAPVPIAESRSTLDSAWLPTLAQLDDNYPHMIPRGGPWPNGQALPKREEIMFVWLEPSRDTGRITYLFQYTKQTQHWEDMIDIFRRHLDGTWDREYTEVDEEEPEANRQAVVEAAHAALDQLAPLRYIVAAQPWLWETPTVTEGTGFEGGELAANLHLYSLETGSVLSVSQAWADPPMMTYVFGNDSEAKARSLKNQLPDELAKEVFRTLEERPRRGR